MGRFGRLWANFWHLGYKIPGGYYIELFLVFMTSKIKSRNSWPVIHFLCTDTTHTERLVMAFTSDGTLVEVTSFDGQTVRSEFLPVDEAHALYREFRDEKGLKAVEGDVALFGVCNNWSTSGRGLAASMEAAEAWKERLYQSYHPYGYGTTARLVELENGLVQVSYSRSNSCD